MLRKDIVQLKREGREMDHNQLARLIRESDWGCRSKQKWVYTTHSNCGYRVYPGPYRQAKSTRFSQARITYLIYVRFLSELVYLAVILNTFCNTGEFKSNLDSLRRIRPTCRHPNRPVKGGHSVWPLTKKVNRPLSYGVLWSKAR